jgi:hypothetical protein
MNNGFPCFFIGKFCYTSARSFHSKGGLANDIVAVFLLYVGYVLRKCIGVYNIGSTPMQDRNRYMVLMIFFFSVEGLFL